MTLTSVPKVAVVKRFDCTYKWTNGTTGAILSSENGNQYHTRPNWGRVLLQKEKGQVGRWGKFTADILNICTLGGDQKINTTWIVGKG